MCVIWLLKTWWYDLSVFLCFFFDCRRKKLWTEQTEGFLPIFILFIFIPLQGRAKAKGKAKGAFFLFRFLLFCYRNSFLNISMYFFIFMPAPALFQGSPVVVFVCPCMYRVCVGRVWRHRVHYITYCLYVIFYIFLLSFLFLKHLLVWCSTNYGAL